MEARNDVADKLRKLMEGWEQSPTPEALRCADRFKAGEFHVLVRVNGIDGVEDGFFIVEHGGTVREVNQACHPNGEKVSVLVKDVELMQSPQAIIPSLIRFEGIDSVLGWPLNTLYFSSLFGWVTIWGMRNRKLNFISGFFPDLAVIQSDNHQLVGKMVEGASQVVDGIPCGGGCIDGDALDGIGLQFCVMVDPDRVSVERVGHRHGFQFADVLVGPFNFYADQSESVVGCHRLILKKRGGGRMSTALCVNSGGRHPGNSTSVF